MLRIRFQRFGKKKAPIYRIAVIEKSSQRDGKPVEVIGFYNPKTKELYYNTERAKYWVSVGAIPTDTVATILKKEPNHDLVNGPVKFKAKSRKEKQEHKAALKTKPSKKKREKEKAAAEAKQKAEEEAKAAAAAAAEKPAEAPAAEATPTEEAKA